MQCLILFLVYGDKYIDAPSQLDSCLRRLKLDDGPFVIIDNGDCELPLLQTDINAWRMGGDNSCGEFSGWQKAVAMLAAGEFPFTCDSILFVNDSFQNYGGSFLNSVKVSTVRRSLKRGAALGVVDAYTEPVDVWGHRVSGWIRSNAFFLPREALQRIGTLCPVTLDMLGDCIDSSYCGRYFKPTAPLSENLRDHIVEWLSTSWHSRFDITSEWSKYALKLCAMLNELMLTAKLLKGDTQIIDATVFEPVPWRQRIRRAGSLLKRALLGGLYAR